MHSAYTVTRLQELKPVHLKCNLFAFSSISAEYLLKFELLISRGNVATYLMWGGWRCIDFVANFIRFSAMQKFWKLVNIWQSYRELEGGNFFETQCTYKLHARVVLVSKNCFCCVLLPVLENIFFQSLYNVLYRVTDTSDKFSPLFGLFASPMTTTPPFARSAASHLKCIPQQLPERKQMIYWDCRSGINDEHKVTCLWHSNFEVRIVYISQHYGHIRTAHVPLSTYSRHFHRLALQHRRKLLWGSSPRFLNSYSFPVFEPSHFRHAMPTISCHYWRSILTENDSNFSQWHLLPNYDAPYVLL